jgi:hypothetical protein
MIEPEPIDFSWFYFVGRTKLNLSFKETGRLTLTMFNKLFSHYKVMWSHEMQLKNANMTYDEYERKSQESELWL